MDERESDGTQPGDGGVALDVERLRQVKLMGFLRELERQEGRVATAALLGVNYKTVARALDEDRVTGRMADALALLLGAGGDTELEMLRRQVRLLAERVAALEERGAAPPVPPFAWEDRDDVPGESEGGGDDDQEHSSVQPGGGNKGTPVQSPPSAPPVAGLGGSRPVRLRRVDPELVTREPAEDDAEVYGDAWPLVKEWRELKNRLPVRGGSLSWLTDYERLLVMELAMLEEHGLTLPPQKQPVRDSLSRRDHTRWRWKALDRTQVAIRKRKLLRWLRRLLTLARGGVRRRACRQSRVRRRGAAAWAFRRTGSKHRASNHGRGGPGACKIRSL